MSEMENDVFLNKLLTDAANQEAANQMFTVFRAFVNAGFTKEEALQLLLGMISAVMKE